MNRRRFVFLDRDGTIIVERHYLADPEKVELIQGAAKGLRAMSGLGFGLIVVTNQSAIGRGILNLPTLGLIHKRMEDLLARDGVILDDVLFCPHTPEDRCNCRKPLPGMVEQAREKYSFFALECFVIGDKSCDIGLGKSVGAQTILTRTGYGSNYDSNDRFTPDFEADNLMEASHIIEKVVNGPGVR